MHLNVKNSNERAQLVAMTEDFAEKGRKYESFKQWEIYQDRLRDFVIANLKEQFDEDTVKEIPIVSSVNLAKRLVNQMAVVYKTKPERNFTEVSDDQAEAIKLLYKDMRANTKLAMANRGYKLQDQSHLWLVPMDGRLQLRVLKNHQITAIPDQRDPEKAYGYIISAMEKADFIDQHNTQTATGYISKTDQYEESYENANALSDQQKERTYVVWTKDFNFTMNEHGDVMGEIFENPLDGELPFVDISWEKEFEYWVRQGTGTTDFTIEFNSRLSESAQVVKMQGFSQAVIKGPKELLTSNMRVGPNYILKILSDPAQGIDGDFKFENPSSDIAGTINWIESLLSLFLSSRGIDPSSVTTRGESNTYSSGLERLLAMIEKISASSEDFDVFERVEERLFALVKKWLQVLDGTDALDEKYRVGNLSDEAGIVVHFEKPEMIQSEGEMLANAERRIDLGISSPIKELMDTEGISREDAEKLYDLYQKDMMRDGSKGRNEKDQL